MKWTHDAGMKQMIADIEREASYTQQETGKNRLDDRVMAAMANVPREQFVPADLRSLAFNDGPLPIGYGQTISQPYMVALMTDLLELEPDYKVLEIGTGSGYQTAILSQLCDKVYSVEVIASLTEQAAQRFRRLGYSNITTSTGNGYHGWPEYAPYDGIIVTAAASHIPPALVEQLVAGGRLVIPIGLPDMHQELMVLQKDAQGNTQARSVLGVAFVPLVDRTADSEK